MSIVAGLQVPVLPFVDVAGKTGGVLFIQTDCAVPNEKLGVIIGFTVTVTDTGGEQGSEVGVNL